MENICQVLSAGERLGVDFYKILNII